MIKKKFFLIFVSLILFVVFCIPIFAIPTSNAYLTTVPADLGSLRQVQDTNINQGVLTKYYLKVYTDIINSAVNYAYFLNDETLAYTNAYNIYYTNDTIEFVQYSNNITNYSFIALPYIKIDKSIGEYIFIPVFCYNTVPYQAALSVRYEVYNSTTTSQDELLIQYYSMGYTDGYNIGYDEGVENGGIALNNLPLVDKLTTFIATFTGDGTAQYITPLAICMILILIYILFIRWVLNLSKSAKLVKLTDIVVLIACICILVVMYVPMLNLTITQHQIVEQFETTSIEETVRVIREPITIVTDETGEIMYGPVGTVRILYESVSEESIEVITESALSIIESTGG